MQRDFRGAVMLQAHALREQLQLPISTSLRLAWRAWKLYQAMIKGKNVPFRYRKVDGTMRVARGRMESDMAPKFPVDKGLFVYYDDDRGGYRSFRVENLMS